MVHWLTRPDTKQKNNNNKKKKKKKKNRKKMNIAGCRRSASAMHCIIYRSHSRKDSVFGFEESEFASDPLALLLDLLLHEVEAHGEQREAEREPERAEDQLLT